jgi:hypothetical protein
VLDTLCLIGAPRTGAGQLMALCANLPEVRAEPDLFASLKAQIDPASAIAEAIGETAARGKRVLMFKLWPEHVPPEAVDQAILSQPGVRIILVMRRQIDAYLSWCKAIETGHWRDADTTDIRVRVDPADFAAWLETQESWYGYWRDLLARRALPAPELRYEQHIDQPPFLALKRLALAAAQVGITLRVPAVIDQPGLVRQDRGRVVADKVSNWPEFSRALGQMGLERRAFGYPG